MREKIYLAPGAKSSELLNSLAQNGINCINIKVMSAAALARYILMRAGITIEEDFLSSREECTYIAKAIAGEEYFGRTTYSDIKQIANAVRRMRMLVPEENEEAVLEERLAQGIFANKNNALLRTYKKYMDMLKENHAIDSVSLIRMAIKFGTGNDIEFSTLNEYPLSPLEERFLSVISGGTYATESLEDLFKVKAVGIKVTAFRNCYGAPNEVESIIDQAYKEKILDQCTVALTDAGNYSQLFFDYALMYDIPVTFGCGVPIINSNPAKLLVLYYHWISDGFFGRDALYSMIDSGVFNKGIWREQFSSAPADFSWSKFREVLGGLRLTNDEATNRTRISEYRKAMAEEEKLVRETDEKAYADFSKRKACIPYLEIAAREFSLPTEDFIAKYAYIRKGNGSNADKLLMRIDMQAVSAIYDELGVVRRAGIEQSTDDMIVNALKISISGERSEAGKLHITDIRGAFSTPRKNVFIAGLSASKFPGSPSENYLLLDSDIELFGKDAEQYTSSGRINGKRENLLNLVKLSCSLGGSVYVSYAGLNVSELKKDNASSMIYELLREQSGGIISAQELENYIEKVQYFEPAISSTREIGNAYNEGKRIIRDRISFTPDLELTVNLDREWSPSALKVFLDSPLQFMLTNLLGLPQEEETDPFSVLTPIAAGNLAHTLMERIANSNLSREEFLAIASEYIDRYVIETPPLIMENVSEAKEEFLEMMENAYDSDPGREVVLKEEDIHCVHESGVRIHGLPDRVEKLEDGSFLIVDYKSGRTINHEKDDFRSCLQIIIYAYLMEQKGYIVSGGEFRYLRLGETVSCVYNDEMKQKLNEFLTNFASDIKYFRFSAAEDVMEEI